MRNETQDFKERTAKGLKACARWLDGAADDLAVVFADGCRDWTIEFSYSSDLKPFPEIDIHVNKVNKGIIGAYMEVKE